MLGISVWEPTLIGAVPGLNDACAKAVINLLSVLRPRPLFYNENP